jgi:kojibiose phosphorylase
VENAAVGIEVAIVARMWMIGLGSVDRFGSAHMVLPNLMDLHLAELQIAELQIAELQTKLGKCLDN